MEEKQENIADARDRVKRMRGADIDGDDFFEEHLITYVQIIDMSVNAHSWKVTDGKSDFEVYIRDRDFLKNLRNGSADFSPVDLFKVKIKRRQSYCDPSRYYCKEDNCDRCKRDEGDSPFFLDTTNYVIKVLEHIKNKDAHDHFNGCKDDEDDSSE